MTVDTFIFYNIAMFSAGWYLLKKHGEKEFRSGIIEGVHMHNEGSLTYKSYFNDEGIEMIDIEIKAQTYEE